MSETAFPPPETPETPVYPDWPMFGLADDVRDSLALEMAAGRPTALVTLIHADGGSPRPPGAQMLVSSTTLCGFLSGGCVEADVAAHARAALADGVPRRLVYGAGSPWPDIRLLCGARIEMLVEPLAPDDPAARAVTALRSARRAAAWTTDGETRRCGPAPSSAIRTSLVVEDAPFRVQLTLPPQRRMVVVGGDPTALAVTQLALAMGYETHLVRPRGPVAPPPGIAASYWRGDAATALAEIGLDPWTFVAVATHDTETDETALAAALPSAAPYVGVLGARRRLPERVARLGALGVSPQDLARLRGPIGLDLGGKSPYEIAVAVMAEATAVSHGRDG
jgi:xanthine dehydrogenase accessory factor